MLPAALRDHRAAPIAFVSAHGAPAVGELSAIRSAIRQERKLRIGYADERAQRMCRAIWPFALAYCIEATLVGVWCELRGDFRCPAAC